MNQAYASYNHPKKCDNCKSANCQCNKNISPNSSLHTKEECPKCHFAFVAGFNPNNSRSCPSCRSTFISGERANHGASCAICSNRYSGSNNVYYKDGCPAIMSDGRFITYYNSTNELTEAMRKMNGFRSPNQFRNYMQKNGDLFMNAERDHVIKENTCSPAVACSEGWYNLWTKYGGGWGAQNTAACAKN